jgi:long-chain fatty acid transport protein
MVTAQILAKHKSNKTSAQMKISLMSGKNALSFASMVVVTLALIPEAFGEGFRNPPPGTFDLGRAGGRIAQVDDASAITANPANLVDLPTPEVNLAPSILFVHVDYQAPGGARASTRDPWKILPNFFASLPLQDGKYALGMGVTVPYGIASEWKSDTSSPFRYTAPHFTDLKTINLNPTFSAKLCDHLKLGVGLDVMWSQLRISQFITPFAPDLEAKANGTGVGYGGNIGLTWQITDRQRLAVTYRSPMNINYSGTFKLNNLPIPGGGSSSSDFSSEIKFPAIVAVGYGLQVTDNVRLETDVEWVQFSRFKNLPINVGGNPLAIPSQNIAQNWRDTFTIGLGGDWQFLPNWTLRGGYQYYQTPVPDSTFSPTIPDANQNVFTVGLNYKHKQHELGVAYGLDFYDQRNISNNQNPAFNGTYQFRVHLISCSYRYSF